jgi:hypothetical protein
MFLEQMTSIHVGFEVLPPVVMKTSILWDITPCSPMKFNRLSEERVASIFMTEKEARQSTNMKQVASNDNRTLSFLRKCNLTHSALLEGYYKFKNMLHVKGLHNFLADVTNRVYRLLLTDFLLDLLFDNEDGSSIYLRNTG